MHDINVHQCHKYMAMGTSSIHTQQRALVATPYTQMANIQLHTYLYSHMHTCAHICTHTCKYTHISTSHTGVLVMLLHPHVLVAHHPCATASPTIGPPTPASTHAAAHEGRVVWVVQMVRVCHHPVRGYAECVSSSCSTADWGCRV